MCLDCDCEAPPAGAPEHWFDLNCCDFGRFGGYPLNQPATFNSFWGYGLWVEHTAAKLLSAPGKAGKSKKPKRWHTYLERAPARLVKVASRVSGGRPA